MFNPFSKLKKQNVTVIGKPCCRQRTLLTGLGKISFENKVYLGFFPSPYFRQGQIYMEARQKTASIHIGNNTIINNNAVIIADKTIITIGNNCRIGYNFQCLDSDFHGIDIANRDNNSSVISKPIKIGNNVFIGNNVIVLKGITIGNGAVIGAGAVVTQDVPDNTVYAGNPAKFIKDINND